MADGMKKCMFCGIDVSQVPRMKDASGRYACKACAEQKMASAKKAAPAPAPAGDAPLDLADMAKAIPGSVQNAKACSSCGAFIPQKAVICTTCGVNVETGKAVRTRVEKAVEAPGAKKARSGGAGINISGNMFAFGVIGILVALFAGSFVVPELLLLLYGAVLVYSIAYYILLVVAAFQDGNAGWGIVAIVSIFLPIGGIAILYYIFAINERASLKILFLAQFIAAILFVIGVAANGADVIESLKGASGGE